MDTLWVEDQFDIPVPLDSLSPVLFLRLLSLEYILVKVKDEEEGLSVEASVDWDDDSGDDRVISESVSWECKEQSLQM